MEYLDATLGFSFELPDNWRVVRNLPLTFSDSSAQIDLTITRVRADLIDRAQRERVYLAYLRSLKMPFAETTSGRLGDEVNVIVGHDPTARIVSVSAVHDNAHFQIGFTGIPGEPALTQLCRSFRFPPSEKLDAFMTAREPCDTRISQLLDQIDSGAEDAKKALLGMGPDAVEGVKNSVGRINARIHTVTNDRGWCSPLRADQLKPLFRRFACRLQLLGQLADPSSVRLLADAVTDAVIAGSQFPDASVVVDAGSDALASIGKDAVSIVKVGTRQPNGNVAKAFARILRAIHRERKSVTGRPPVQCGPGLGGTSQQEGASPAADFRGFARALSALWLGCFLLLGYLNLYVLGSPASQARLGSFFVASSRSLLVSYGAVLVIMAAVLLPIGFMIMAAIQSRDAANRLIGGAVLLGLAGATNLVWWFLAFLGTVAPPEQWAVKPFFGCSGCLPFAAWFMGTETASSRIVASRGSWVKDRMGIMARFVYSEAGIAMVLVALIGLFLL